MKYVLLTFAGLSLGAGASQAATLSYAINAISSQDRVYNTVFEDVKVAPADAITLDRTFSESFNVTNGRSIATSALIVDPATGKVKYGSSSYSEGLTNTLPGTSASARTRFELKENFLLTGTGSVTFFIDVDGYLEEVGTENANGNAYFDSKIDLRYLDGGGEDRIWDNTGLAGSPVVVDYRHELTVPMYGNDRKVFLTYSGTATTDSGFQTIPGTHSTVSNFLNTATLGYAITGDVTVTASDPLFLSNMGGGATGGETGGPSTVPLPAGLPLLAGALGLIAMVRRRR